jgi:DNA-binding MarR family transcriptional regulator
VKQTLNTLCQQIALGRHLARALNAALKNWPLTESEFRLLWLLTQAAPPHGTAQLEQRAIAQRLGLSAGQVSAMVERLRCQQLLTPITNSQDRRQQQWQLTGQGQQTLHTLATEVHTALRNSTSNSMLAPLPSHREEAA